MINNLPETQEIQVWLLGWESPLEEEIATHSSILAWKIYPDIFIKVKVKSLSRSWLFATPWIVACTKLLHPWDFQGKSTGVVCHSLLQGIFPTQGSNPGLSHCRQTLYCLSHQGSRCFLVFVKTLVKWPLRVLVFFFKFRMIASLSQCHCENKLENICESLQWCLAPGGCLSGVGSTQGQALCVPVGTAITATTTRV